MSIVIPVFNEEQYLEECIESVLCQSFTDFELLLINDGSTDNSGEICDNYTSLDDRVKVYHKKNGGVSSARNLGIEKAKGVWVTFIDSDDFIKADFLQDFINNHSLEFDLLIQGVINYGTSKRVVYKFDEIRSIRTSQFFDEFNIIPYFFGPWSKFFKRSLIMDNDLRFDISKSYAEDTLFNLDYLLHSHLKILLIDENNYCYRDTPNSLSTKILSFKERKVIFVELKSRLLKLTTNNMHYYWYSIELIGSLYKDTSVKNKHKELKRILKNNKEEILAAYKENIMINKLIILLIKTKNYICLNLLYKFLYGKTKNLSFIK